LTGATAARGSFAAGRGADSLPPSLNPAPGELERRGHIRLEHGAGTDPTEFVTLCWSSSQVTS
jgi:hypothetical protein